MPNYLKYANFTCKFGELDLLENLSLFDNVVLPAFERSEPRQVDETFYRLDQVEIVTLDDGSGITDENGFSGVPVLALAGFLVKASNEKIGKQYESSRGYYEDPDAQIRYQTALFFTLILNSHRMIYYRPSPKAPTIKTFQTTMRKFLREAHDQYIRSLKIEADEARRQSPDASKTTLVGLKEELPPPTLNITELSGEGTLASALNNFKVINRARFVLQNTNADLNLDGIHVVRELKDQAASNESILTHENETQEGLNKEAILTQADEAAKFGSAKVLLSGKGLLGDTLTADNGTFAAKTAFREDILNTRSGAKATNAIFNEEVAQGRLQNEDHSQQFGPQLRTIWDRLRRR